MRFDVITLFPEMFSALNSGITGRALRNGLLELKTWDLLEFCPKKTRADDQSFGGGPGMVMRPEPLHDALLAAQNDATCAKIIYLSPQGQLLTQKLIQNLSKQPRFILLAGRYEGIDERIIQTNIDLELSLGDYILSGGELAAMVLIDTITRLLPGALGDEQSANQDSFTHNLLDHPHYTRPATFNGQTVPNVLLSGNHAAINKWRLQQALGQTLLKRPDLLAKHKLTEDEHKLLIKFVNNLREESHE